jgi:hypothetical protein
MPLKSSAGGTTVTELESVSDGIVTHRKVNHYLACRLEEPVADAVHVNRYLSGSVTSEKIIAWLTQHGASRRRTPSQTLLAVRVARVTQIGEAWAAERSPARRG